MSESHKIIGYTTGVYDLFHIGHLNILKQAKDSCDHLIVGITTDELSENYKKKKPVIPYADRAQIVKNIRFVDEVVPQNSMDKMAAWNKHRFHRMFVGDDWKGSDKWTALEEDFKKVGVEIVYFPYTQNVSTSTVRKIIESEKLLEE